MDITVEGDSRQTRAAGAMLSRRRVLAGLLATPFVVGTGTGLLAAPASAAPRSAPAPGAGAAVARAGRNQYRAPLLTPGHRIKLPGGAQVMRGTVAGGPQAWPHVRAADGELVDLSVVREYGAPSQSAYLTGFTEGWYELVDARGRTRSRVEWDVRRFPGLLLTQEWGASRGFPMHGKFFSLGLEPFARCPLA